MVSGIECAGLVLGVLPLLIEAAKYYSKGLESLTRSRKYVSIIDQYRIDLVFEQTKFNMSWQRIIELIDPETLRDLYKGRNLAEDFWQSPDIDKLQFAGVELTKLLSQALVSFNDAAVRSIEMALQEIGSLVQAMAKDFLKFVDEPLQKDFFATGILGKKSNKKALKMLKAEIKGGNMIWNEQLARIRQRNQDLYNLVYGEYHAKVWASVCSTPKKHIASTSETQTKLFNIIHEGMEALHIAVKESLEPLGSRCCEAPHRVALQLGIPDLICDPSTLKVKDDYRFRVSFAIEQSSESNFRDLDMRLLGMPMLSPSMETSSIILCSDGPPNPCDAMTRNHVLMNLPNERGTSETMAVQSTGKVLAKLGRQLVSSIIPITSGKNGKGPNPQYHGSNDLQCPSLTPPSRPSSAHTMVSSMSTLGTTRSRSVSCYSENCAPVLPSIVVHEPDDGSERGSLEYQPCKCTVPNHKRVTSLCSALHIAPSTTITTANQSCIGILSSTSGFKFHVCPCKPSHLHPKGFIPLREIMSSHSAPSLSLKLKLAVLLASSVMQLHGTGWLKEVWSSADIYFQAASSSKIQQSRLSQPSVHGFFNICSDPAANGQSNNLTVPILFANKTLFALGIVLVELIYWKPFLVLQGQEKSLVELVEELEQHAGLAYRLAVQGCVQGFKLGRQELGDDNFKKLVYEEIVSPLESVLKQFSQEKDLRRVFADVVSEYYD